MESFQVGARDLKFRNKCKINSDVQFVFVSDKF